MTKLETAMRMRGMRPIDLAGKLGITRHNMGNYLHGIRALGPAMLPAAAGALGVSQAYLRGIADRLPVYDLSLIHIFAERRGRQHRAADHIPGRDQKHRI